MIESVNNERVKNWTKLQDKKYINDKNEFIVEGIHLVDEAKKANTLKEVILLNGEKYDFEKITYVNENVMKKITSLTNPPKIIGISEKKESRDINGNVLILDSIRNPGNLGTIIRSAIAFNIDTIILGKGSVNLYNPKVVRATEGQIFNINIIESDIKKEVLVLKNRGYKVYSTNVVKGQELKSIEFPDKVAIIMGNEGAGVSDEINSLVNDFIYINMNTKCESLNVGVATSIILYELNNK